MHVAISLTDVFFGLYALIVVAAAITKLSLSHKRWAIALLQALISIGCSTGLLTHSWPSLATWLDHAAGRPGFHTLLGEGGLDISAGCGLMMGKMWQHKRFPLLPALGCLALLAILAIAFMNTGIANRHEFGLVQARDSEYVAAYFFALAVYIFWTAYVFITMGVRMIGHFGGSASAFGLTSITAAAAFATVFTTFRLIALIILWDSNSANYRWFLGTSYIALGATSIAFVIGSSFPLIAARQRSRREA